ncbi:MAG: hypothetical protein A2516_09125 [Alphaproteobacteria bacterium RIFOXYD12_FULL_60_8]|nr:MAG: hypothetical protein A2516_09125 [Alphaproteobacteria bacterium RIFOXYD12_FULL_60_8]
MTPGAETGTFVGKKVVTYRSELEKLQGGLSTRNGRLQDLRGRTLESAQIYHRNVADINYKLQAGTTPSNPILQEKWRTAQAELNKIPDNVNSMTQLATEVSSDSAMAAYLLDSIRSSYALPGSVDEDHRQLQILEDETNRTVVLVERLLNELNADITRQQDYLRSEVSNINTLAVGVTEGQAFGVSLTNKARAAAAPQIASTAGMGAMGTAPNLAGRRPLVVIRFDQSKVAFEKAVYQAVSRVLEKKPSANFDLVAVAPSRGTPGQVALLGNEARRNATNVMRSLSDMGLPAEQVHMSTATSDQAITTEVHLYVR